MALSFLYFLLRRVGELLRIHRMEAAAKDAEILAPRHQLADLRPEGRPSPLLLVGPGAHRDVGQAGATRTVGSVARYPRDNSPLTSRAGPSSLDLSPPRTRSATSALH